MQPQELTLLIRKYLAGKATPEEHKLLEDWYQTHVAEEVEWDGEDEELLRLNLLRKIQAETHPHAASFNPTRIRRYRLAAAASFFVVFSFALYFFIKDARDAEGNIKKTVNVKTRNDISPGGNKAVLTLSDGSRIILEESEAGVLANQGNAVIMKKKDGQLIYDHHNQASGAGQMNEISTPRGGQYQVILSDGTKVWLNASSSLKFPATFTGSKRSIELTGEAYFEVQKDKKMPFYLKAGDMEVEVLGTHFNIMAYKDEDQSNTTLVEGLVMVKKGNGSRLMKPGEQAVVVKNTDRINLYKANIKKEMAWQRGYYIFERDDVESIMRKISRWYDVEIVYAPGFENTTFTGTVSRFKNLSDVLRVLESTEEVHFKLEGRRVTVMP
ncbi:FecR family protein [Pararcticibacter amylolyticus]|uniref:Anti-sigma factor n=1 Tax=Pararcticibacter amylolyticus TaxID=2173175 RepID=A0A2U2PGN1_9SPHI|nr:FecR family protein [Pararcticibacter amylolyticus]PWG80556.1 anti-sigma factor [Pararcticibacter amylolyticus]